MSAGQFCRAAVVLALGLATAACSDDTADPGPLDAAATTTTAAIAGPTTSITATTTTTTTTTPLVVGATDLAGIIQTTPEAGNPVRPRLMWEPIDGAAEYEVVAFHPDGRPWWAWSGTATEVVLGGVMAPAAVDLGGPQALVGTTWAVLAYDADGQLVAVSPTRALEP